MNYPQIISSWILDLIFPIRCVSCGKFCSLRLGYLCKKCAGLIPINKKFECIGCNRVTILGKTCPTCRQSNPVDQLLVVSDYKNPAVIKIVKTLKYRFIKEMAVPISLLIKKYVIWLSISKKFNVLTENPIIVPIPLHKYRYNWRGFNQAELIAEEVSKIINCSFDTSIIRKRGKTKSQADIKEYDDRLKNIKEAFELIEADRIKNRTIVLVDDVCTTGATLNECARVLKESGAGKVVALVFARG